MSTRRHNKTFTGCWTCRIRKVKCDEGKPQCSQCRSRNVECEGYEIRLHWIAVQAGLGDGEQDAAISPEPRNRSQRSRIVHKPHQRTLHARELDEILSRIDDFNPAQNIWTSCPGCVVQNFGVFRPPNLQFAPPPLSPATPELSSSPCDRASTIFLTSDDGEPTVSSPESNEISGGEIGLLEGDDPYLHTNEDVLANHLQAPSLLTASPRDVERAGQSFGGETHGTWPPESSAGKSLEECSRALPNSEAFHPPTPVATHPMHHRWYTLRDSIIQNPSPTHLSDIERFLMYHYHHRVVQLFCVFDNKKSPWKTIHLPRALQSVGQLTVQGLSSPISEALRNTLLSISAFYFSNDSKSRVCYEQANRWAIQATIFRGKAIQLLNAAMENDVNRKNPPKYKDCLATILSMISINVMSGDTSTCVIHLDGALHFMKHARTWKRKYSPKAQALHRIYSYLRTIHDSTSLRSPPSCLSLSNPSFDATSSQPYHPRMQDDMDLFEGLHPTDVNPAYRMTTYEYIYGIPQSLLALLTRVTDVSHQLTDIREKEKRTLIPTSLLDVCDNLEKSILDWPIESELRARRDEGEPSSAEIICQTTRAFHNALIIYFAQHIRLMHYHYLQRYVQIVLDCIEAIERVKSHAQVFAAPLHWPGFIAGSEAFDKPIQDRFRNWYRQVDLYGIASVRTGISILTEIWANGPTAKANRYTSRWRLIVERRGSCLMLT